jgi:hypothetical protein
MFKTWIGILAALALTAACAPLPTSGPRDARIEGTPDKAVIYLVRSNPDLGPLPAQVVVNDNLIGSTHPGTYYRLEVPAGRLRITGYTQDTGAITLDTQAGGVYFVQHKVSGTWRSPTPHSFFSVINEGQARAVMARAWKVG